MKDLMLDAARRGADYLAAVGDRPVMPVREAIEQMCQHLGRPLQEDPMDPALVLADLDTYGAPATMATTGGRYFGFVIGGALPATVGAGILATAWDQNAGMEACSPFGAELEQIAAGWVKSLLGLDAGSAVGFVTGATMANFTGLAAARHAVLAAEGWNVEDRGLFGAPPITVVVGEEVHVSLLKAVGMLGLGRERVLRVPVDGQGRMQVDMLPPVEGPTIVCLQAGNVNSGACDSIGLVCHRLRGTGAWVHVDGAFGLWAAASPAYRSMVDGIGEADSIGTDAHKWLNVPYDSGLVFVRDPGHLKGAMSASAAYLVAGANDPHLLVPEMSRRVRGIEVWAALRSLGTSGVAKLVERTCAHARRMASALEAAGHEILNDVVLNQVLVTFGSAERTRAVISAIQRDGTCWCGGTTWHGRVAMRISVSSWATTDDDVDRSLAAMLRIAKEVPADGGLA